jgi:hypothetical protein
MTKPPMGPKEKRLQELREERMKGRPPIDKRKALAKVRPITKNGGGRGR